MRSWVITVAVPTRVLRSGQDHFHKVSFQANDTHSLFRFDESDSPIRVLHPKSVEVRSIPYHMTSALFRDEGLRKETVTMAAYVNDELVGELVKPFWELQEF